MDNIVIAWFIAECFVFPDVWHCTQHTKENKLLLSFTVDVRHYAIHVYNSLPVIMILCCLWNVWSLAFNASIPLHRLLKFHPFINCDVPWIFWNTVFSTLRWILSYIQCVHVLTKDEEEVFYWRFYGKKSILCLYEYHWDHKIETCMVVSVSRKLRKIGTLHFAQCVKNVVLKPAKKHKQCDKRAETDN